MNRNVLASPMPLLPIFGMLLAISGAPALAGDGDEASVLRLFFEKEDLVTAASRVPEAARTAPATVDVFTREDIENTGARTLSDLLRTLESVYIAPQTSSRESLWIRGIRNRYNDKVLLLMDGVPWRDPVYENAPVDEYLPLTNVERVEVIRGPGSALYGTNAFAGVINIVTRTPPEKPFLDVQAAAGDYSTREAYARGGFTAGGAGLFAFLRYFDTDGDGLDLQRHQLKQVLRQNPKKNVSGGLTLTAGDFTLRYEQVDYDHLFYTDWDVPTWRWGDEWYKYRDTFVSGQYAHSFGERWGVRAVGYYQDYDLKTFWREFLWGQQGPNSTPDDVEYDIDVFKRGRRVGGDVQFNANLPGRHELVGGATYEKESLSLVEDRWLDVHTGVVTRPFYIDPVSTTTWALYAQDIWRAADWATLTLGVRGDHNSVFGWHVTPRVGVTFHPGQKLVLKLLYGEAFRAPSAREFYTVDLTGDFPPGNPDLEPERIQTWEAGLSYTFSPYVQSRLVLYQERTFDAIYSENNAPYDNHPGDTVRGVEAGVKLAWPNKVTAYANISYTDSDLYNVPKNTAHAGINVPFCDRYAWNLNAIYVSKRPRDPKDRYSYDPTVPPFHRPDVGDYLVLNTTFRIVKVWRGLELNASIYNLLDRDYFDPTFEPTKYYDLKAANRTYLVRLVYRF